MPSLHDFLRLPVVLLHVESAHKFSADRLRDKLCSYPNDFAVEAERLTAVAFGPAVQFQGGDEDAYTEWAERGHFVEHQKRLLECAESYLWGLGIAGVYHQFERDVRKMVGAFTKPAIIESKLNKANFACLCSHLANLGYQIEQSAGVDVARLIANAIKHGEGDSCRLLSSKRPDLFVEQHRNSKDLKAKIPLNVEDLRVGVIEFDQAVSAISTIWSELKAAVSTSLRP